MFNYYGLGPCRECWIENGEFCTKKLFSEEVLRFPIFQTQFFKEHHLITDDAPTRPASRIVTFEINSADGYTVRGYYDGFVNVIKDNCMVGLTSWEWTKCPRPTLIVGYNRYGGLVQEVLVDQFQPDIVYGLNNYAMAQMVKPLPNGLPENEVLYALSVATSVKQPCIDSYFIGGYDEQHIIKQRCLAAREGRRITSV